MKPVLLLTLGLLLFSLSCKEKTYIYEVNDVEVSPNNADKNKQKTEEQFISILYANLYQKALSPNQLIDLSDLIRSIGDKRIAFETITAKMLADPEVLELLPSPEEMRSDVERFVTDTYKRFLVRLPTEAEKTYFVNFIESHPNLSPEHIYFAFATCDEYYHY